MQVKPSRSTSNPAWGRSIDKNEIRVELDPLPWWLGLTGVLLQLVFSASIMVPSLIFGPLIWAALAGAEEG